jgi:NAD(P)H-dependent FMN reductase
MPLLQVFLVSTRPGRVGAPVAEWFRDHAARHNKFEVELVDLAQVNLPLFDEPTHPRLREYAHEHTKAWSARVARADAFVFVTPEYNHGAPPSLVNAIDYLVHEWAYKPAAFVSYGGAAGGARSVQMTKLMLVALKVVPLPETVLIPFFATMIDKTSGRFAPPENLTVAADAMLNELRRWTDVLQTLRSPVDRQ